MFDSDSYTALFERITAVRSHREAFLDELRGGTVSLEKLFERAGSDPVIGSMKVLPAIEALPEAGKVQTRRAFEELEIAEDGLIAAIDPSQVVALPAALERHAR